MTAGAAIAKILAACALIGLASGFGARAAAPSGGSASPDFDVLVRGGAVLDGTGAPAFRADVGIVGGRILAVGDLAAASAARVIDARGLVVAPGFINIHDHSEPDALPTAANMLRQGVTTAIVNADGWGDTDLRRELAPLKGARPAINVGANIGFNAVWAETMGANDVRPTPAQIAAMAGRIETALKDGAWGVSAGLDYKPAYFAASDEVVKVIAPAGSWRTIFPNHDRLRPEDNWSSRLGMAETVSIASRAGLIPVITHMKSQGLEQGQVDRTLDTLRADLARGRYRAADVYPYLAGLSSFEGLVLPGWAVAGGREAMLARFKDPQTRAKIAEISERAIAARFNGPSGVFVASLGRELTDIMAEKKATVGETVIQILEAGEVWAIFRFGAEADLVKILKFPTSAISCDCGAALGPYPHPRIVGTFPRVLGHYVRETGDLTLPDAVRKMTGLPASLIGMTDRGWLAPGMAADIVVFDPATIADRASFADPNAKPVGVRTVLVNGVVALDHGEPTGAAAGQALWRAPFMPSRPETRGPRSAAGGARDEDGRVLSWTLRQGAGAREARGQVLLRSGDGGLLFRSTDLGLLQSASGWTSITAAGLDAQGRPRALMFVVDSADPIRPGQTLAHLVVDGQPVFEGSARRDPSRAAKSHVR